MPNYRIEGLEQLYFTKGVKVFFILVTDFNLGCVFC